MKLYRLSLLICLMLALILTSGCITVEKKEYRYTLKPDGSGEGTIRYVNILSSDDNGKDVSFKDFAELVTDYLQGSKFEDDYPALHATNKKLVEENGQLVAVVDFTFTSADSVGFLKHGKCDCCPVMYFINTDKGKETITESNGKMITTVASTPFVEWDAKAHDLTLKTTLMDDTTGARSMISHYRAWKEKK